MCASLDGTCYRCSIVERSVAVSKIQLQESMRFSSSVAFAKRAFKIMKKLSQLGKSCIRIFGKVRVFHALYVIRFSLNYFNYKFDNNKTSFFLKVCKHRALSSKTVFTTNNNNKFTKFNFYLL